jgi:hypothetical protein
MAIKEIPIAKPSRLIMQDAKAAIQHFCDAIVELVTNSDDSYKRLESEKKSCTGEIEIYVEREKGGKVKEFYVKDFAEGIPKENLEKVIAFGEETSGFIKGKSVRGLFGRGLKQAIIALEGEAEIFTRKDGEISKAKIWWDPKQKKALYEIFENNNYKPPLPEVEKFMRQKRNGTLILIKVKTKDQKYKIPEYERFKTQISNHYALRDINASEKRNIKLIFIDRGKKNLKAESKIEFHEPEGELKFNNIIKIPRYGDEIQLRIKEAAQPLTTKSPRYDPFCKAGILIKTKGAILDNQLFRFENDPVAYYFVGEAYCEGIAKKIEEACKEYKETEIIDEKRKGLNWRSSYCQAIQKSIEKILEPLIEEKKKELEEKEARKIPQSRKKMMDKLCDFLNQLAKKEIEEWEGPGEPPQRIEKLTVIPPQANVELNKPKLFAIYAPEELVKEAGNMVSIFSENGDIKILVPSTKRLVLSWTISLAKHPKKLETWYGTFKVIGKEIGKEAYIHCKLGNQSSDVLVKVVEPRIIEEKEKKEKKKKKGGLFSEIIPDLIPNPTQRAQYIKDTGEIKVFINFPSVKGYLGPKFKGIETREGKIIMAEIIGEVFCRSMAQEKIERGQTPYPSGAGPDAEIPAFLTTVNEFQKKYLDKIHKVILNYKI